VLDHIFVMCDQGAPGAAALLRIGLEEMTGNTHPGQGTACRRFHLSQQYLELLWVSDTDEVRSAATRATQLWERWAGRPDGACPFGLVFRAHPNRPAKAPFRAWSYSPGYLPPGLSIEVAEEAPLAGPAFFFLPFVTSRPARSPVRLGTEVLMEISRVQIGAPVLPPDSEAARWAHAKGLLSIERSDHYVLTISLDGAATGHVADARPDLPLVLKW
jgi:Glyoxalase-like domain